MQRLLLPIIISIVCVGFGPSSAQANRQCSELHGPKKSLSLDYSLAFKLKSDAQVKPLPDAFNSLLAKLSAIDSAQKSIELSTYIFRSDDSGLVVTHALAKALDRGVKVRILVDAIGSFESRSHALMSLRSREKYPGQLEILLVNPIFKSEQIKARLSQFISSLLKGRFTLRSLLSNRMHDKLLLIDAGQPNALAILGSRNIGNEYSGLQQAKAGKNFDDFEIAIRTGATDTNNIISTLQEYFTMSFERASSKKIEEGWLNRQSPVLLRALNKKMIALTDSDFFQAAMDELKQKNFLESDFTPAKAEFAAENRNILVRNRIVLEKFVVNPVKSLHVSIRNQLLTARKKLEIVSPYMVLFPKDILRLKLWLHDNPESELHLYTTALRSTDSPLVQAYFDNFVAPSLMKLAESPEYQGRIKIYCYAHESQNLHTKLMAVDEKSVLVTSSNFDPRSRYSNSELGIWLESDTIYKQMSDKLSEIRSHSHEFGSKEWSSSRRDQLRSFKSKVVAYVLSAISNLMSPLL